MGGKKNKNKQKQPQAPQTPVAKPAEPKKEETQPKPDISQVKEKVAEIQKGQEKLEKQAKVLQKKEEEKVTDAAADFAAGFDAFGSDSDDNKPAAKPKAAPKDEKVTDAAADFAAGFDAFASDSDDDKPVAKPKPKEEKPKGKGKAKEEKATKQKGKAKEEKGKKPAAKPKEKEAPKEEAANEAAADFAAGFDAFASDSDDDKPAAKAKAAPKEEKVNDAAADFAAGFDAFASDSDEDKPKEVVKPKKKEESKKAEQHGDEMMAMDPMGAGWSGSGMGWGDQSQTKQEEDIELQTRLQTVLKMSQTLQQGGNRIDSRQRKLIERQIKLLKPHAFWDSQPVRNLKHRDTGGQDGQLEKKQVKDVKQDPLPLPAGFEWCTVDLNDDNDAEQLYTLLKEHYVEDSEGIFRFEYSVGLIKWVLLTPNYNKEWHVGLRNSKTKKLLGFISGTPCKVQVNSNAVKMAEINFLCVNKKLRTKRMTPMLIQEVTRRVNLTGIWSAIYTSGDTFPYPFTEANYFHRNLNPRKNIETGFSALGSNETMAKYMKKMKLHDQKDINIIGTPRLMISKDLPQVFALYKQQMQKMKVSFKFNQQELGHHLLPRDGIIYTIVFEDVEKKKITDFVSFYNLPSQILKQKGHNHTMMNVAYLYYYGNTVNNLTEMMKHVLVFSKEQVPDGTRFDVFNCLNIMENSQFLQELKFGVGDGILNYYMYNYVLGGEKASMNAGQLGTVLV